MDSVLKKSAWMFCVQYLLLNTTFAYFGRDFADGDKTFGAAESRFLDIWKNFALESVLMALLVAAVFGLICLVQKKHAPPKYLGVVALCVLTELFFVAIYLFIVRNFSPMSVALILIVSHLLSWTVLISFRKFKATFS